MRTDTPLRPLKRSHRLTGRYLPKVVVAKSPSWTRGRKPCKDFLRGKCTNPSCDLWHLSVCYNYKSEPRCIHGEKCKFRQVEVDGQPCKKSKKIGGKGSVALLKESIQLGCVSNDCYQRNLFNGRKIGIKSHHQIVHGNVAPHQNSGKKGSIARSYSKV